ncbi:unnamed protein product [Scytosiphon promiscuus]
MAGVGRRTLYRKSVTDDYLNSTPEPGENEEIALAQAPRGSNIIEIMLASGEPALALLPTRFRKLIWVKRGDYLITSTSAGDFETSAGEAGKVRHRVEHILNKDQVKHLKKQGLWPADDAFGGSLSSAGVGSGNPREGWGNATDTAAGVSGGGTGGGRGGGTALGGDTDGDEPKKAAATGAEDAVGDGAGGGLAGKGSGEEGAGAEPEEEEEGEEEEEDDMSDLFVNNNRAAMMQLRTDHEDDEEDSDSDSDE